MKGIRITVPENAARVPFGLDGRILYSSGDSEIVYLVLKAGEKIESHVQPFEVLFYAIEGSALLLAEGKEYRIQQGSLAEVKAGLHRGWHNDSGDDVRLLVIKKLT